LKPEKDLGPSPLTALLYPKVTQLVLVAVWDRRRNVAVTGKAEVFVYHAASSLALQGTAKLAHIPGYDVVGEFSWLGKTPVLHSTPEGRRGIGEQGFYGGLPDMSRVRQGIEESERVRDGRVN